MANLQMLMPELRKQFEDMVSQIMASDQGQRVIEWYEHLGARDRIAFRALAGFLIAALIYMLMLQPMLNYGAAAQRDLQEERELLVWLQAHESLVSPNGADGTQRDQPVTTIVNDAAREHNITVRRYEPVDDDSVRVALEGASFNDVVKWLYKLENSHGIHATDLTIEREAQAGRVNVRLTLSG